MVIGRGSCTNWSSPACPQYCLDENPSGGQALSPCESTPTALFSCGLNNCATSNFSIGTDGVEIVLRSDQIAGLGLVPAASSSSASAAAESSGATSNSSLCTSSSNSPTAQQDTDDKKLIGVGVGLGVPLGLALIAALTLLGIEKRKNNQYRAASTQMHQQQLPWYDFLNKPSRLPMAEMGTNEAVSELPSRDSAPALPIKRDHTSFFDG
ncbi:hypothetical protein MMC13_000503 [Lambiella insularis]|nr:hypothetical protein [Lambiella insularis]